MTNLTHATDEIVTSAEAQFTGPTANREYKSTVFAMLYDDPERLLSLYNALNHSHYTDPEKLKIVTLKNAVYMAMKNDVAFVLASELNLYEHQSTPNPNMPLRDLFYVSREYEKMVTRESLYASKLVKIPNPIFVVFYNGTDAQPERQILKLSDLYEIPQENPMLELQVEFLNINKGFNQQLKEECKSLKEYMLFVDKVRSYTSQKDILLDEAVEKAVTECIREGILSEFLEENRREVVSMSIFEYDHEREMELYRKAEREVALEEGRERGLKEGREKAHIEALSILITSLKKYLPDVEAVFREVTEYEEYRNCSREQILKLYKGEK